MKSRRQIFFLILFTVLLLSRTSAADTPYAPQIIPACPVADLKDGGKGCAYTLDQVKLIYHLDAELVELRLVRKINEKLLGEYKFQIDQHVVKENELKAINTNLTTRIDQLTTDRLKCDRDLQDARAKPAFSGFIGWAVAGVAVAITAGIIISKTLL